MEKYVLLANLMVTGFLTGLIWFVQVVHYPCFRAVSPQAFADYHTWHLRATSTMVALPMLIELLLAGWMLKSGFPLSPWLNYTAFVLVLLIWLQTVFIFMPLHHQLHQGYQLSIIKKLVAWNWSRTFFWTLRFLLLGWACFKAF